jgi:Rieske 2Fe-2S family protein
MTTVIQHPTYWTSLPREYYHSPEIFEQEIERIYNRQWRYYAHISQLPEPGDYVAREMLGEGVIVIRGSDGEIRGFLNHCRHRGSRLCPSGVGNKSRFVCPYHQWRYSIEGKLMNAPTLPDGENINYPDWGLHELQVEVWHGFIMVCLGQEPLEPLASLLAACDEGFTRAQTERLKEARVITYDFKANWKTVMEGFFECYHCPAVHSELVPVVDVEGYAADVTGLDVESWQYGKAQCKFQPGAETFSRDGRFSSQKLLGDADPQSAAGFNIGAYIQPSALQIDVYGDFASVLYIEPESIDSAKMVCHWFVHEDAEEGVDYELDRLTELADLVNRQDQELCEIVSAGIKSRRYVPGPLSIQRERSLRAALGAYVDLMAQE